MSTSTKSLAVTGPTRPENGMDLMTIAQMMAKSGYFADARDAAQAVVKILAGQEMGFGPFTSMANVHIIKGKPAFAAVLVASAIKRSGRYSYVVKELSDSVCALEFTERGRVIGTSTFSMADATKAGIKSDMYGKFPRNMLFSRAMSNGARWYCADIFGGSVYTPDELGAEVTVEDDGEITVVEPRVPGVSTVGNGRDEPPNPHAPGPEQLERWARGVDMALSLGLNIGNGIPDLPEDALRTDYAAALATLTRNVKTAKDEQGKVQAAFDAEEKRLAEATPALGPAF